MNIVQEFHRYFSEEEEGSLAEQLVSLGEVEFVLKGFAKSKTPGPGGWLVELFLEFFDIMGHNRLDAVEESRSTGKFKEGLNSTYIALIPKVNKSKYFSDFRPISLCNLIYNVI